MTPQLPLYRDQSGYEYQFRSPRWYQTRSKGGAWGSWYEAGNSLDYYLQQQVITLVIQLPPQLQMAEGM